MSVRFQRPSRSFTSRDYQFIVVAVLAFLAVAAALVFVNLQLGRGGEAFYIHWAGSRAFLFDKLEPYSGDVAVQTQSLIQGASSADREAPYFLGTPFHILPFYFLFALVPEPMLARAIFTSILEAALLGLAFLSLRLTDWEAPRYFSASFILFGIFNFYSIQAIYAGSPMLIVALLYAGILLSMEAGMDELSGALIALTVYSAAAGAPFLILIISRMYAEKRGGVLAGFFMLTGVLLAISFLLYPGWIIPFLRASINNLRAEHGFSVLIIANHLWPAWGRSVAWICIGALVILLGLEWSGARQADFRRFHWAACLTIAITPLFGIRTEMNYLAVLLVPLALVFAVAHDRWSGVGAGFVKLFLLLLLLSAPWTIAFFGLERFGMTAREVLFLFLPISTVAGLYWIRWWAIQPPRTWRDAANRSSSATPISNR